MFEIMIYADEERFYGHGLVTEVFHVDLALNLVYQVNTRGGNTESSHTLHSFTLLQNT